MAQTRFDFDQGLVYSQVGGQSLLLDLYVPHPGFPNPPNTPAVPAPVIVWIHGEGGQFADRYPSPIASMTGNGYAVAEAIATLSAVEATVRAAAGRFAGRGAWLRQMPASTVWTRTISARGEYRMAGG